MTGEKRKISSNPSWEDALLFSDKSFVEASLSSDFVGRIHLLAFKSLQCRSREAVLRLKGFLKVCFAERIFVFQY